MQWVRLGLIGKTYRLDGSFFVSERDSAIPKSVKWVVLSKRGDASPEALAQLVRYGVERSRPQAKRVIAKLADISSIEAITPHQGSSIWTTRDQIPVNDTKEYLWAELEGRAIIDSDGKAFGTISAVQNFGAGDVVEVTSASQQVQMLPFTDYYFDMSFANEGPISLVVSGQIFEEFWQGGKDGR